MTDVTVCLRKLYSVADCEVPHVTKKTNLITPLYCEQLTQHMSPMNHRDTFKGKIKGNKLSGGGGHVGVPYSQGWFHSCVIHKHQTSGQPSETLIRR